jgi:hypothetical protein
MTDLNTLPANVSSEKCTIKDEHSIEFLLREYERLVEYQKITIESYDRWFNIYLAAASAGVIILVPLAQAVTSGNQPAIINIIILGLLILGLVNFVGLSFSNATSIQYERAMRLIQDFFIEHEPLTSNYLYFRKHQIGIPGTGIKALIGRALTGGSPKSFLVLINSLMGAVLLIKVSFDISILSLNTVLQVTIGIIIFVLILALHLIYARIVYKVHGIS